ncbi:hypothetical protein [Paraburkholderia hospita]|uniref:hypothetical protein n=1 Tax=Paraburkholderia hospita TaxID=169430 RepID=UPI00131A3F8F|nr:hypothetical protein [Paraburkholderia hospita]
MEIKKQRGKRFKNDNFTSETGISNNTNKVTSNDESVTAGGALRDSAFHWNYFSSKKSVANEAQLPT